MPIIRVVYRAKEYGFDYVSSDMLDTLITQDKITHFYRPSERRWISVKFHPIRGSGGVYQGTERRRRENKPDPNEEKVCLNAKALCSDWVERFFRLLESQDDLG